jgi:hypothetical protein
VTTFAFAQPAGLVLLSEDDRPPRGMAGAPRAHRPFERAAQGRQLEMAAVLRVDLDA